MNGCHDEAHSNGRYLFFDMELAHNIIIPNGMEATGVTHCIMIPGGMGITHLALNKLECVINIKIRTVLFGMRI